MKSLPAPLQAHLDTGATTLAWCWRVTRNDGIAFGFTDHDRDLVFDGTAFEAATGFTASEIKDALGLSVDNLEVSSALKSDRLSEDDLAAGLYDDAAVEIWRVNWADTEQRVLMRAGSLGEVRRSGSAFTAEVRGLVTFTSGANSGRAQDVKRHALAGTDATIELWQPMALTIAPGDTFTITAGCDKQFATCQAKFANAVNFRGFPHMPGNDYILAVARPGEPVTTAGRG